MSLIDTRMSDSSYHNMLLYKRWGHATYPATGYFQCKVNHFETRPFHAKFEENR